MDNLTPVQRSYCMSRVKTKDTGLEKVVATELRRRKLRFRKQAKSLPGKPDIVFLREKVAVFVDGDFWHGYRFPQWKGRVSPFWRSKIGKNRKRDKRNFANLRRMGWRVIRVWKHNIQKDLDGAVAKICDAIQAR